MHCRYQDPESKESANTRGYLRAPTLDVLRPRRHSSRTRVSLDRHAVKPWTGMVVKRWTGIA